MQKHKYKEYKNIDVPDEYEKEFKERNKFFYKLEFSLPKEDIQTVFEYFTGERYTTTFDNEIHKLCTIWNKTPEGWRMGERLIFQEGVMFHKITKESIGLHREYIKKILETIPCDLKTIADMLLKKKGIFIPSGKYDILRDVIFSLSNAKVMSVNTNMKQHKVYYI